MAQILIAILSKDGRRIESVWAEIDLSTITVDLTTDPPTLRGKGVETPPVPPTDGLP